MLIFDREGYSPVFIKEMWQTHRIACITYHKFPKEAWPVGEFAETQAEVDSQIRSVQSKLNRKPVEFAAHTIRPQLFAGEIATNLGDRLKISRLISVGKIQDIEVENDETHRTRNGRTETVDNNESIMIIGNRLPAMRNTGFSVLGAQQILLGQPVTSHNDRDSVPE